jgi:Holliday junction resolvase
VSYARRTDRTHAVIRDTLRKLGWFVLDVSAVPNFVDMIAAKHGRVIFIEAKDGAKSPSRRKLRPSQEALHRDLRAAGAEVMVIESGADVQTWAA